MTNLTIVVFFKRKNKVEKKLNFDTSIRHDNTTFGLMNSLHLHITKIRKISQFPKNKTNKKYNTAQLYTYHL